VVVEPQKIRDEGTTRQSTLASRRSILRP
jgi:hypothetical protein